MKRIKVRLVPEYPTDDQAERLEAQFFTDLLETHLDYVSKSTPLAWRAAQQAEWYEKNAARIKIKNAANNTKA